jgi:ribokinase
VAQLRRRIVVLGGLNTDLVVGVPRLPRPAETVMGDRLRTFPGGKGANQAVAAARLGGLVSMVGRVGSDAYADLLLASLAADGVDVGAVERDAEEPTGVALIMVEDSGQNMIAVAPGANARVDAAMVLRASHLFDADGLLLVQLEVPPGAVEAGVALAREHGTRVILNAAPATSTLPDSLLRAIDVLVANEIEASTLVNSAVASAEDAAAAAAVLVGRGAGAAIVTLGAAGAVVVDASGTWPVRPYRVDAVDATAAGDAFVGALGAALASGADLRTAADRGAAAGAAAAAKPGAQSSLPTLQDLASILDTTRSSHFSA